MVLVCSVVKRWISEFEIRPFRNRKHSKSRLLEGSISNGLVLAMVIAFFGSFHGYLNYTICTYCLVPIPRLNNSWMAADLSHLLDKLKHKLSWIFLGSHFVWFSNVSASKFHSKSNPFANQPLLTILNPDKWGFQIVNILMSKRGLRT